MDWGLAGSVILSGLAIVFMILIILVFAVLATGKIVNSASSKTSVPAQKPASLTPKPSTPAVKPPVLAVQPGIEEETVAVISAAVYSCLNAAGDNSGVSYAVKSISRASGERPVWGFAGMQQNTRPF